VLNRQSQIFLGYQQFCRSNEKFYRLEVGALGTVNEDAGMRIELIEERSARLKAQRNSSGGRLICVLARPVVAAGAV